MANDAYCTPELKAIVRRVAGACGLLEGGGGGRGCQPLQARKVAALSGTDFNAIFEPLAHRARIVQFDATKSELDPAARRLVENAWSDQRGASFFFVVSRASRDGDEQYNEALSRDRAKAVLDYLDQKFHDEELKKEVGPAVARRGVRAAAGRVLQLGALPLRLLQPRRHQPQRVHRLDRLCHLSGERSRPPRSSRSLWPPAVETGTTSSADGLPERFAGVRRQAGSPRDGAERVLREELPRRRLGRPAVRGPAATPVARLEVTGTSAGVRGTTWTWVNLWATWCAPCVEEMELLGRWRDGFSRDGMQVGFELISIDAPIEGRSSPLFARRGCPGRSAGFAPSKTWDRCSTLSGWTGAP